MIAIITRKSLDSLRGERIQCEHLKRCVSRRNEALEGIRYELKFVKASNEDYESRIQEYQRGTDRLFKRNQELERSLREEKEMSSKHRHSIARMFIGETLSNPPSNPTENNLLKESLRKITEDYLVSLGFKK